MPSEIGYLFHDRADLWRWIARKKAFGRCCGWDSFVVHGFSDRHFDSLLATSSDRSITRIKLPESTLWIAASS